MMMRREIPDKGIWLSVLGGLLSVILVIVSFQSTHTAHVTALADAAAQKQAEENEREARRAMLEVEQRQRAEQQREREYYYRAELEKETNAAESYQSEESVTNTDSDVQDSDILSPQSATTIPRATDAQNANQAFDGDPTYVSGTWCRNDGKCITISAQSNAIDGDLLLDASGMGAENPLPSGKTIIPMGYWYQSPPPLSIVDNQIRMITQWSFLDASGTVQESKYAFGSTPNFVEEPLFLTRVSPYNTEEVENLDSSNPPKQQDYIFLQPYNMQARSAVSDDTVFYRAS